MGVTRSGNRYCHGCHQTTHHYLTIIGMVRYLWCWYCHRRKEVG